MLKLFSKSKPELPDYSILQADTHSHLLPGIDDGSPDIDTSLELIRGMVKLGYKKLITTPHIMWDMYRNTNSIITQKLKEVKEAVAAEGLEIELHAAAEYFIDDHLEELLKQKEPLLTLSDNLVLVEFSMASPSFELKEVLFEMQLQGYQPVIAHPERYIYLEHNKSFYDELKDAGYWFQLNLLSLGGYYGRSVAELAQYLIRKGYYDLAGSDLHNFKHLDGLFNPAIISSLKKLVESGTIKNNQL
jgi:protein-tyrosine phosphatase